MEDFIVLINPTGSDVFTPDIIIAFFGICLIVHGIGALVESCWKAFHRS